MQETIMSETRKSSGRLPDSCTWQVHPHSSHGRTGCGRMRSSGGEAACLRGLGMVEMQPA